MINLAVGELSLVVDLVGSSEGQTDMALSVDSVKRTCYYYCVALLWASL